MDITVSTAPAVPDKAELKASLERLRRRVPRQQAAIAEARLALSDAKAAAQAALDLVVQRETAVLEAVAAAARLDELIADTERQIGE